ncbi:hypothetical protein ACNOYE_01510 [Nannocystaceae bacterium ST9]
MPDAVAIRIERAGDRALVDRLWQQSVDERSGAGFVGRAPSADEFPTSRFLIAELEGECVGIAGTILPAADARFSFEKAVGFPHDAIPTRERSELCEGLGLYVVPAQRMAGLSWALTFLAMLIGAEAGATTIVAENGGVSLRMALAAGLRDTGVVTKLRGTQPYHLTVGALAEVLAASWAASRAALGQCRLEPTLAEACERFSKR